MPVPLRCAHTVTSEDVTPAAGLACGVGRAFSSNPLAVQEPIERCLQSPGGISSLQQLRHPRYSDNARDV